MRKLIFLLFLVSLPALAAPSKRGNRVVDVDFDDELHIKGKFLTPSLFTLFQRKNIDYGKLIKPRKDFLKEMRDSAENIE